MNTTNSKDIVDVLRKSTNIGIAGHTNPDADSIGACFAMAMAVHKANKKPMIFLEEYNNKYEIIPGKEFIFKGDIKNIAPDAFISLDCNSSDRLGFAEEIYKRSEITVCIDHHVPKENFFCKYNYINKDASSTCELVFELINNYIPIDDKIATALYAGIIADTGGLRHPSTSTRTLSIVSKLMETGINFSNIYREIMFRHSNTATKIFSIALSKVKIDGDIAYTVLSKADFIAASATKQDLDGIVDYLLNIENISVAVFFYDKEDVSKVSVRSKEKDISKFCNAQSGGGHKLAGGFDVSCAAEDAATKIIPILKKELELC